MALTAAPNHSQAGDRTARATLRSYRLGDWQAMYALDLVCFEPVFQFSRGAMRGFAEAPGAVTVLAEAQGELAGFCVAQLEQRTGYVVTLDVAPAWRRRGLARRLMADVESKLHSAGATDIELHVFTGNAGAIRFYESIGYARVGEAKDFYAQSLHALLYRKEFAA
ncbi:MAG: GNAT family N-acetyltransferase [Acidobacteriaceae bacterium]